MTYMYHALEGRQVHQGGFSVRVGDPRKPEERFSGADCSVAFINSEGPVNASAVGPDGVTRTFRILKGTRLVNLNEKPRRGPKAA
jgi:hypothetical protein